MRTWSIARNSCCTSACDDLPCTPGIKQRLRRIFIFSRHRFTGILFVLSQAAGLAGPPAGRSALQPGCLPEVDMSHQAGGGAWGKDAVSVQSICTS